MIIVQTQIKRLHTNEDSTQKLRQYEAVQETIEDNVHKCRPYTHMERHTQMKTVHKKEDST